MHNIDHTTGKAGIAFMGSRNDIWHRLGQEKKAGESIQSWAEDAGLDWTAIKVPAFAQLQDGTFIPVPDRFFNTRSDNNGLLGETVSNVYQNVQPKDVLNWFDRYISVDSRFALDVAGSLKGGSIIWATATFNGGVEIGGSKHVARVLMTTTFDGTGSTVNKMTTTRVVCNNTLDVAMSGDKRAVVKTRHNTKFDAAKVGRELGDLAKSVDTYKAIGDAMATNEMSKLDVAAFFKTCLDIPFDAKYADLSTRKQNQFQDLGNAYRQTVEEGTESGTTWTALQAVTRYVDHDRTTRGGDSADEARCLSSQFGSGAGMKAKAMDLLMPRIKDRILIAA